MRIVFYKNGKFLPTTENWVYSLLSNLLKSEPVVYCNGIRNEKSFPYKKIRVFPRYNLPHQITRFDPRVLLSLLKDRPAIVHAHFMSSGRDFIFYKKFWRAPLITSSYGVDITSAPQKRKQIIKEYSSLFRYGDFFLTMGNYMAKQLRELGCPKEKIIIQHLGIDLNKIPFRPRRLVKNSPTKILMAARFTPKKGLIDAVSAIGLFVQRYPKIKIRVTVVGDSNGSPSDNLEKAKILDVVEKYKLSSIINFVGSLPHEKFIKTLYASQIFLSPSVTAETGDNEGGYLMSALEASASGMPIISTKHCDIPDTIIEGKTGYLVPEHRPDLIATRLKKLIDNHQRWPLMGKLGRKHMAQEYDNAKLIPKLENIYDQIVRSYGQHNWGTQRDRTQKGV